MKISMKANEARDRSYSSFVSGVDLHIRRAVGDAKTEVRIVISGIDPSFVASVSNELREQGFDPSSVVSEDGMDTKVLLIKW